MTARLWGYKPDGSACVFTIPDGGKLPAGWSDDVTIMDIDLRDGERLTKAAGTSVTNPVPATPDAVEELRKEVKEISKQVEKSLRYDENNRPVTPAAKHRIG